MNLNANIMLQKTSTILHNSQIRKSQGSDITSLGLTCTLLGFIVTVSNVLGHYSNGFLH